MAWHISSSAHAQESACRELLDSLTSKQWSSMQWCGVFRVMLCSTFVNWFGVPPLFSDPHLTTAPTIWRGEIMIFT